MAARMATLDAPTQAAGLQPAEPAHGRRFVLAVRPVRAHRAASCGSPCLVVFALAAVTDWLDGYLARKHGLTSTLGRNLDPLVDKVLICGAFIFLLPVGDVGGWQPGWSPWSSAAS